MDAGQLVWIIGSWTIGVCIAAVAGWPSTSSAGLSPMRGCLVTNRRERRSLRHGHTGSAPSILQQLGMTLTEFTQASEELVRMGLAVKSLDPDGEVRYRIAPRVEVQEIEEDDLPSSVVPFQPPVEKP